MDYRKRILNLLEYKNHLKVINNKLYIDNISLETIAEKYGTPTFVYSEKRIRENYRKFYKAFRKRYKDVEIRYAMKANSNPYILKVLKEEGSGIDAVSVNEIKLAISIGFSTDKIIYTGVNRTKQELEYAIRQGVLINVDSLSELDKVIRICEKNKIKANISFRYNPEIDVKTHKHIATGLKESKFGLHENDAFIAYKKAKKCKYLNVIGIHMHIGSQITSSEPFEKASEKLLRFASKIKNELGIEIKIIDFGGGLGIKYKAEQQSIDVDDLATVLIKKYHEAMEKYNLDECKILLEPGRYIVADSCVLLTRVTAVKHTPYKKFVGVDAGFNLLIRPVLYDAYHETVIVNEVFRNEYERYDIVGYLCESGDVLAKDRELPKVQEGDIIAFLDTGAYCSVMASNYNMRERALEVAVKDSSTIIIRRRESYDDLISVYKI